MAEKEQEHAIFRAGMPWLFALLLAVAGLSTAAVGQAPGTAGDVASTPLPVSATTEAAAPTGASEVTGTTEAHADDPPAPQAEAAPEPDPTPRPPVADNVDLSEPVALPDSDGSLQAESAAAPTAGDDETGDAPDGDPAAHGDLAAEPKPGLVLLGTEVMPGTSTRLSWSPTQSFAGIDVQTPVLVVNGVHAGPVLCLTGAVHGDELNGIEIVRRVLYDLDPDRLAGTVIGVPIVNLQGFRRGTRYLSDRRDLNRFFPGNPTGSAAARIAHSFFNEIITHCDALVDIHTGSFHRANLPQLRADLTRAEVVRLTQGFGSTVVLHSDGAQGTLRRAAVNAGIPAVTLEAGAPQRVQEKEVDHGVKGIQTLLNEMGMVRKITIWGHREPVYYRSTWVRADQGGVLVSQVALGDRVRKDEVIGTVTDPITNVETDVLAPVRGRVLGMALNQFVMPGFAAFHIGIEKPVTEVTESAAEAQAQGATEPVDVQVGEIAPRIVEVDDEDEALDDTDFLDDSE